MSSTKIAQYATALFFGVFFLFSSSAQAVVITPPPVYLPTATLSASPSSIGSGETVTLSWSSTDATSCSVTQGGKSGFNTGGATSGSDSSSSLTETTTFAISCTGTNGTATDDITVRVKGGNTTPPSGSCSANQTIVTINKEVIWTVVPSGGSGSYTYSWSGTSGLSGSSISTSKKYTSAGTKTASVEISSNGESTNVSCSNSVVVSSVSPSSTPPSDVRGIFFNPTILFNGQDLGTNITEHYFEGTVREQFKRELQEFKEKTNANAVLLWAWPHMGISWPLAESNQIKGLSTMILDAKALGLDTILGIGHPYIVPKSRMLAEGTYGVCDHHAGDVVGGLTLLWDMAPCTEDVITPSKAWFSSVIDGLESRGVSKKQVAYLMVGGHYKLFYGGEFNMLRGGNVHLTDAQAYLSSMIPYLHSITNIPVGLSLLPKTLQPGTPGPEDFLTNLFAAVPLEQLDVLDITWSPYVRKSEIVGFDDLLENAPEKVILSDFKTTIGSQNGMSRASAITHTIDYTKQHDLAGYWMFVYKDMGDSLGLKDVQGGWREDLVDAFKDGYNNTPPNDDDTGSGSSGSGGSSGGGGSSGSSGTTTTSGGSDPLTLLRSLIQQFIAAGGTPTPTILAFLNAPATTTGGYARDLDLNSEGSDVLKLEQFLIAQNKGSQAYALGVAGASTFFGPLTQKALAEYQASVGITPASGYFGPKTRAYIAGLGL